MLFTTAAIYSLIANGFYYCSNIQFCSLHRLITGKKPESIIKPEPNWTKFCFGQDPLHNSPCRVHFKNAMSPGIQRVPLASHASGWRLGQLWSDCSHPSSTPALPALGQKARTREHPRHAPALSQACAHWHLPHSIVTAKLEQRRLGGSAPYSPHTI